MQLEQDTFYVGDTVTLDLEFTNEPTEQPRWSKDQIQLHNDERVSIENVGNRVSLVVRDLRLDDAGKILLRVFFFKQISSRFCFQVFMKFKVVH